MVGEGARGYGSHGVGKVPGKMVETPLSPGPHPQAQPSIPDAQRQVSALLSGQELAFSMATAWGRGNYTSFTINRLVLNLSSTICRQHVFGQDTRSLSLSSFVNQGQGPRCRLAMRLREGMSPRPAPNLALKPGTY